MQTTRQLHFTQLKTFYSEAFGVAIQSFEEWQNKGKLSQQKDVIPRKVFEKVLLDIQQNGKPQEKVTALAMQLQSITASRISAIAELKFDKFFKLDGQLYVRIKEKKTKKQSQFVVPDKIFVAVMELKAQAILKKQGATPRAIKMLNELDWQIGRAHV